MADYFTHFACFLDARKSIDAVSTQDCPAAALNVGGADAFCNGASAVNGKLPNESSLEAERFEGMARRNVQGLAGTPPLALSMPFHRS